MLNRLKDLLWRRAAAAPFPADTPLDALRYVVVDTELTSLDRSSNRILSIGAIGMEGTRVCLGEQFYAVVNPGVSVPAETVLVHGLRPADVAQGLTPQQAVTRFLDFAKGSVLAGHFVSIDLAALKKELPATDTLLDCPALDTIRVQRWLDLRRGHGEDRGHQVESVDLLSLARRYGLDAPEAHHALFDALLTAQLWQRLIYKLEKESVTTLGQALKIGKALG